MKYIIEIKKSKVAFILELLNSFNYVKVKPISEEKAILMDEIQEAVEELKLVRQGKLEGIPAKQLLDEL